MLTSIHKRGDIMAVKLRWQRIKRCARKAQSMVFDFFKAFDYIESSHKSGIFTRKDLFSFMRAQHVVSYHLI